MEFIPLGTYGRYPNASGATSGYLLKDGDYKVLIDFGSGVFRELAHVSDCALNAVVLTHLHFDHIADALVYQYYLEYNNLIPVELYLPDFPSEVNALFTSSKIIKRDIARIGTAFNIESRRVKHAKNTDSYMLKITGGEKTLIYTSDFSCVSEYAEFVKGADIAVVDACVSDAEYTPNSPHASIKSIAAATPVDTALYLAHLTDGEEGTALAEAKKYHANTSFAVKYVPIKF